MFITKNCNLNSIYRRIFFRHMKKILCCISCSISITNCFQFDSNVTWGNEVNLTYHLHYILMDLYPDLYEKCTIHVKEKRKYCEDQLKACNMMKPQFKIDWPINIVIRNEHVERYQEIFQFVLKIKWALFTLNHLYFEGTKYASMLRTFSDFSDLFLRYSTQEGFAQKRALISKKTSRKIETAEILFAERIQHYSALYFWLCFQYFKFEIRKGFRGRGQFRLSNIGAHVLRREHPQEMFAYKGF